MNGSQDGSATQTITGLTPGKTYQASVWAEVSGKTASITVSDGDTQLATNYMAESNVVYGIHHTDKYKRYLQRMWVEFTAPESGTVTLALTGTNGTGENSYVHFDDVRIVEHTPSDYGSHYFYEDFENVTEGYGPFVSTESDTSHLSETNAPYTFDTIDGRFSLKTRAGDYFRTLPHTHYTTVTYLPDGSCQEVSVYGTQYEADNACNTMVHGDWVARMCGEDTKAVYTESGSEELFWDPGEVAAVRAAAPHAKIMWEVPHYNTFNPLQKPLIWPALKQVDLSSVRLSLRQIGNLERQEYKCRVLSENDPFVQTHLHNPKNRKEE